MNSTERIKLLSMAGMLTLATSLTVYFHAVLHSGLVFTHLFYLPVILGALWWGRKGLGIAIYLGLMLVVCHWSIRPDMAGPNDYFRAIMFVVVSLLVLMMRKKILASEAALKQQSSELQQRVQALGCLYAINRLREKSTLSLPDIFRKTIQLLEEVGFEGLPAQARITYEGCAFGNETPSDCSSSISSPIIVGQQVSGQLDVGFCEEPSVDTTALNDNARELTEEVARRLAIIINHENARAELERHRHHMETLVQERTEELIVVNRRLREEIAERLKTELSLRESEYKYRLLFENANEAIYIAQEGRILFPNPALTKLSGYSGEQLLGREFKTLVHPEDADTVYHHYRQRIEGGSAPNTYAFRLVTANGTNCWVEINAVAIEWRERPATLNFLRDISSRKKIEATLGQIQKMEAIGVLAAGIAHKFNNALASITGSIDLLKLCFPDHPEVTRYCQTMFQSVETMTGLTRQLLAYARGGKYQARRQSLSALTKETLQVLDAPKDKNIQIETLFAPNTPDIEGDAVQLRMVLQAILSNSAEAVQNDGLIRIHTFRCHMDAYDAAAFDGLPSGEYAGLCVADDGIGMTEETSSRIFEPFFTTKFLGRGMGMAAVYGIIKNHGGYIYVDSETNHGTVMHIFLPASNSN